MSKRKENILEINFTTFNRLVKTLLEIKVFDDLIEKLILQLAKILHAQRATFYFYNENTNELWSYFAMNLELEEIRVPLGKGVVGKTGKERKILNIKDVAKCKFFCEEFDRKSGFLTHSVLSAPLVKRNDQLLGVIQIVNKKDGSFTNDDTVFLQSISHYIVNAIENIILHQEQETLLRSMLYALSSAIDAKDPVTAGHSHRVAYVSVRIGQKLGLPEDEIKLLEYAAYLHDIGKIGIPENILKTYGKLTKKEYDIIQQHPTYTLQILENIAFPDEQRNIPLIASSHHEWLDGTGYPQKLKGKEIPLFSRIIAVADIYDALSAFDRPYKRPLSLKKTLQILRDEVAKKHIDRKIVDIFITHQLYKYERRRYKRFNVNISMSYQIIPQKKVIEGKLTEKQKANLSDLKSIRPHFLKAKDISEHGVLFIASQYYTVGMYLDIQLKLSSRKIVKCIGKIVWIESIIGSKNYKAGVFFVNFSSQKRKALAKSLSQLTKKRNTPT